MEYEVTTRVDAPAAAVWAVLVDVERWPEWTPSMRTVQRLDDGGFGLGSAVRIRQPKLPPTRWEVTEFDAPHGFTWTARSGGMLTTGGHRVRDNGDGTSTVTLSFRQTGALAPLMALLYGRLTRRYVELEAAGLKRRAEQRPRPAT